MKIVSNLTKLTVCIIFAGIFFSACQPSQGELEKQITQQEQEALKQNDTTVLNNLLSLYQSYIERFPQDSLVAKYLFNSGKVNMSMRKGAEALRDFTNFTINFPQHELLPEAYYYIAYTYEDIMNDISAAKTAYYDFLVRFPDHKLATDANLSIKYLGMSPEAIVASFEQNDTTSIE